MNWKEEIQKYGRKVKEKRELSIKNEETKKHLKTKKDIENYNSSIVIPVFEEIAQELGPFVTSIKINKFKYTAHLIIEFDDKYKGKAGFSVKPCERYNSMSFPQYINICKSPVSYGWGSGPTINLDA